MISLGGRVAIVTGASSGLGYAIARKLGLAGASTVLVARSKDKLDELAKEISSKGGTTLVCPTDVGSEQDILRLFETTMSRFGRVDILINNAGIVINKPTVETSLADWQRVVDVNLTSVFLCSREAMKIMQKQKRGRIINIGSVSAAMPRPNTASYAATKAALIALTHSCALDGREHGITASILHPGVADSNLSGKRNPRPPEVMMQADEIAEAVHMMVTLPDTTNFFNGTIMPIGMPFLGRG